MRRILLVCLATMLTVGCGDDNNNKKSTEPIPEFPDRKNPDKNGLTIPGKEKNKSSAGMN
jgi:hypothetical protein